MQAVAGFYAKDMLFIYSITTRDSHSKVIKARIKWGSLVLSF